MNNSLCNFEFLQMQIKRKIIFCLFKITWVDSEQIFPSQSGSSSIFHSPSLKGLKPDYFKAYAGFDDPNLSGTGHGRILKIRQNLTLQFLHVHYNVQHLKQTYNIMYVMNIDSKAIFLYDNRQCRFILKGKENKKKIIFHFRGGNTVYFPLFIFFIFYAPIGLKIYF